MTEDELESLFETGLTDTAAGDLVPLPSMPLLAPPPGPDDPSVAQAVEQGHIKQGATGERPAIHSAIEDISIGDEIVMPDGSRTTVTWLDRKKGRIAIGKGRNKTFMSLSQIDVEDGKLVSRKMTKKKRERKREDGDTTPTPDVKLPTTVPKGLFPYQLENVAFIMRDGPPFGGLIADEMGLGKTLSAIACIETPAVVVCPSLLKVNWVREINRWMPDLSVALLSGTRHRAKQSRWKEEELKVVGVEAGDLHQQTADVVVLNYEIIGPHLDWLTARNNKTLIFDEAHYLKELRTRWDSDTRQWVAEPKPQRAAASFALRGSVVEGGRLILLTGTPILNRAIELWPLLHLLYRGKTSDDGSAGGFSSRTKFCLRYCAGIYEDIRVRGAPLRGRLNCNGLSHVTELHTRISGTYMIRHTKEAELKDLPPKERGSVLVSLSPKYAKMYRHARTDFYEWVAENGGPEAVMAAQRAEALVQLTKLRAISAQGKALAAVQYIARFFESTGRPLIVMGEHRSAFALIEAGIEKVNEQYAKSLASGKQHPISRPIRMGIIVGGQGGRQRQKTIDAFQKEGTIDVLLYSIRIATGVTLTRASDMLFIERLWRPADQVQAEDRIHRIGQTQKVKIVYMDAEGTVDMKLGLLLADKVRAAAAIIDGEDLDADEALKRVFGAAWGRLLTGEEGAEVQIDNDMLDDLVRAGNAQADAMAREEVEKNPSTERLFTDDGEWFDDFEYDDEELEANPRYDFAWDVDSWGDPL